VLIDHINVAPVADAGEDQNVLELEDVFLDGSGSSDHEGQPLTYTWTGPEGIILNNETSAVADFTAPDVDVDTEYTFTLEINDGVNSNVDTVVIIIINTD